MIRRLDFRDKLLGAVSELDPADKPKLYFQPPANIKLEYPCIIYSRDDMDIKYADNKVHNYTVAYMVTIIDKNPDTKILPLLVENFNRIAYDRFYTADNLNHDVLIIYY